MTSLSSKKPAGKPPKNRTPGEEGGKGHWKNRGERRKRMAVADTVSVTRLQFSILLTSYSAFIRSFSQLLSPEQHWHGEERAWQSCGIPSDVMLRGVLISDPCSTLQDSLMMEMNLLLDLKIHEQSAISKRVERKVNTKLEVSKLKTLEILRRY